MRLVESGQSVAEAARTLGRGRADAVELDQGHKVGKLVANERSLKLTAWRIELRPLRAELERVKLAEQGCFLRARLVLFLRHRSL